MCFILHNNFNKHHTSGADLEKYAGGAKMFNVGNFIYFRTFS